MKKNILIFGGTRGMGLSLAHLLLKNKNNVILIGREKRKSLDLEKQLISDYPNSQLIIKYNNIKVNHNFIAIKQLIKKKFKNKLNNVVSFLGTGKTNANFDKQIKDWKNDFDKNFFVNVNIVSNFYKILSKTSKGSAILLTSALAGSSRVKAPIGYSVAKSSLITYVNHVAPYLAEYGVRIISVSPGNVFYKGGRWEEIIKKNKNIINDYIKKEVPLKRLANIEEIAWIYFCLLNKNNTFMTGNNIILDGGQSNSIL